MLSEGRSEHDEAVAAAADAQAPTATRVGGGGAQRGGMRGAGVGRFPQANVPACMAMCHAYSVCSSGVGGVSSLDTLLTRDARLLLLMSLLFFLLACCGPCGTRAALSTHLPMRSCVLCACVAAAALYLYDPRTAQRCIYEGGKGRGRQQKGNAVEMGEP